MFYYDETDPDDDFDDYDTDPEDEDYDTSDPYDIEYDVP